jgi:hypothetical protein
MYLGFYPQTVTVKVATKAIGSFMVADDKSANKLLLWWNGNEVFTDTYKKNEVVVFPATKIRPWESDEDRRNMLATLGFKLPEDVDLSTVTLHPARGRVFTLDALTIEGTSAVDVAKQLHNEMSNLTGAEVQARLVKFTPAERKKFLQLLAGL